MLRNLQHNQKIIIRALARALGGVKGDRWLVLPTVLANILMARRASATVGSARPDPITILKSGSRLKADNRALGVSGNKVSLQFGLQFGRQFGLR